MFLTVLACQNQANQERSKSSSAKHQEIVNPTLTNDNKLDTMISIRVNKVLFEMDSTSFQDINYMDLFDLNAKPIQSEKARILTLYHSLMWDSIKYQVREALGHKPKRDIEKSVYFSKEEIDSIFRRNEGANGLRIYFSEIPVYLTPDWGIDSQYFGRSSVVLRAVKDNLDMFDEFDRDGNIIVLSSDDYGTICPPKCNPKELIYPQYYKNNGSYLDKNEIDSFENIKTKQDLKESKTIVVRSQDERNKLEHIKNK